MKVNVSETSRAAYRINKEGFESRQAQALAVLKEFGSMTSNELFLRIKHTFPSDYRHNTHARLAGLRDAGLVRECGKKVCDVTSETVIVWGLVEEGQQNEFRERVLIKKLHAAQQLVEKLQSEVSDLHTAKMNIGAIK